MGMPKLPPMSLSSPTGTNSLVLNTKAAIASATTPSQRWRSLRTTATGEAVSAAGAEHGERGERDIAEREPVGGGSAAVLRAEFSHAAAVRGRNAVVRDGRRQPGMLLPSAETQPSPWIACACVAAAVQRRSPRWKNRLLGICISVPSAGPPISCSVV